MAFLPEHVLLTRQGTIAEEIRRKVEQHDYEKDGELGSGLP